MHYPPLILSVTSIQPTLNITAHLLMPAGHHHRHTDATHFLTTPDEGVANQSLHYHHLNNQQGNQPPAHSPV